MNAAKVLEDLKRRFPNEPEYHQAVEEVLSTIEEEYNKHPEFDKVNLIERLCIPDRVYQFRVTWMDDKGNIQTNMGYRVQHNNAIGPYKGGIRFHSSVNLGNFEIPCLRADIQKFTNYSSDGWWQRRFRLLSAWQIKRRSNAFLPGIHVGIMAPYRS